MKKIVIALVMLCSVALSGVAQKYSVIQGDIKDLKGVKEFTVVFDYSNMKVGEYTEADYLKKRSGEAEAKEAGKGEIFIANWNAARQKQFEPKFIELFNKIGADKKGHIDAANPEAKYVITVKTTFTEPGYNVGVWRQPAYINIDYIIAPISEPTKPVCTLQVMKVPGQDAMGYDFDASYRISEGYAKAGKSLAAYFEKQIWK